MTDWRGLPYFIREGDDPLEKRKVTAEDIFRIALIGDVAQHPTRHSAAVAVTRLNREDNKYYTHIWLVQTDSGEARLFTASDKSESKPAWSPDGKWLAFLSNRTGEDNQLYVIPEQGGEAVQVTRLAGGVDSFRWNPDGRSIGFIANVSEWSKDEVTAATAQNKSPREKYNADVKVITRTVYRLDGVGYFGNKRNHLYVVNVDTAVSSNAHQHVAYDAKSLAQAYPCARVTEGPFDVDDFDWSPTGNQVVLTSNVLPDADESMERHLYTLNVTIPSAHSAVAAVGSETLCWLPNGPKVSERPRFSPDAQRIAFFGHNFEHSIYTQNAVWVYDVATQTACVATAGIDEAFGDLSIADTRGSASVDLTWSDDARYVYTLLSTRGTTQLVRVDVTDGGMSYMTQGAHCVLTFSLNRNASTAAIVRATPTEPCDVYIADLPMTGDKPVDLRRVSAVNDEWLSEVEILSPRKISFSSDHLGMDGWALLPTTPAPPTGYPTVLQVHGGPMVMYGEAFFFEFQLLAASGIAVIYCNPRGSMGYGQAFCSVIRGDWGQLDFNDIETFVDTAEKAFPLNGGNIAIAGGSYGGFMAAWAIGHTNRYKASIVMRACINEYSMFGTCDVGFADIYDFGTTPWENPDRYFRVSPIASAHKIRAHVLILHSENDLRCPIEQAEQLYTALRMHKVPVEFVRFANESHGLSRSGQPWHRVYRLEKIQNFLMRELQVATD